MLEIPARALKSRYIKKNVWIIAGTGLCCTSAILDETLVHIYNVPAKIAMLTIDVFCYNYPFRGLQYVHS